MRDNSARKIDVTFLPNDKGVWFKNSVIHLKFDQTMYCKIFYKNKGNLLSLSSEEGLPRLYSLKINEIEFGEFNIINLEKDCRIEEISNKFGTGKRLTLCGKGTGPKGCCIEKILDVELYSEYPNIALMKVTYRNLGNEILKLEEIYCGHFLLDSSMTDHSNLAYDFWSFQGGVYEWGRNYIFKLEKGFYQENYQGFERPYAHAKGGGVPAVDLWNKNMGLIIASMNDLPTPVSLPVQVREDRKVRIGKCEKIATELSPQGEITASPTVVIVHSGDFYDGLQRYSQLMEKQGLVLKSAPEEAYEPIWCSWGFQDAWMPEDIYAKMNELKELGIPWIVIDCGWYECFGDWNPDLRKFPKGESDVVKMVKTLQENGFLVKLWWAPAFAASNSQLIRKRPDYVIKDLGEDIPTLSVRSEISDYPYAFLCPSVPEVQQFIRDTTRKFINKWGFDGLKLDLLYTCPPCYAQKHNHPYPGQSTEDFPSIFRIIYKEATKIKPNTVIEICPCGTAPNYFYLQWQNQPVTADPIDSFQVRKRIKLLKALTKSNGAVYADHVELTRIIFPKGETNPKKARYLGRDFASQIGCGAVPGTKFTKLSSQDKQYWKKWLKIYDEERISQGEYLNLYDIAYDKPEAHVIRKRDELFYAFFASFWNERIQLRGLDSRPYELYDLDTGQKIATVTGPVDDIEKDFREYLLLKAIPLGIK
jgi:alpha-galactosidase